MSTKPPTQFKDLDRDTKVVFTCIGSYLSEIYFHTLYLKAKENRQQQKVKTTSEGYREAVRVFLKATKSKTKGNVFAGMVKNIAPLFHAKGKLLTSTEVIACIAKELVPRDYYTDLTADNRQTIVKNTLFSIIEQFTALIYAEYITDIVDDRKDRGDEVQEKITNCIIEMLIAARDKYYWKFAETNHRRTDDDAEKMLFQKARREAAYFREECEEMRRQLSARDKAISEMKKAIAMRDVLIRRRAEELSQLRKTVAMRRDNPPQKAALSPPASPPSPPRARLLPPRSADTYPSREQTRPRPKVYRPGDNHTVESVERSMLSDDEPELTMNMPRADGKDDITADDDIFKDRPGNGISSGDNSERKRENTEKDKDPSDDIFADQPDDAEAQQRLDDVLNNKEVEEEEAFINRAYVNTAPPGAASAPPPSPPAPAAAAPAPSPQVTEAEALKTKPRKSRKKIKKEADGTAPGIFDNAPDI